MALSCRGAVGKISMVSPQPTEEKPSLVMNTSGFLKAQININYDGVLLDFHGTAVKINVYVHLANESGSV
jgi:hypothetical protein